MINRLVKKEDIIKALKFIDQNGTPKNRLSAKYNLYHNKKNYPPKYVISIATKIATGKELEPSEFNGGVETNNFLISLGFKIREGSIEISTIKSENKQINICTALIQIVSNNWDDIKNSVKFKLLSEILSKLSKDTDILILPAGFINSKEKKPESIYKKTEQELVQQIHKYNDKLFICFGIDGRNKTDQLALTINKTGIVSIARKFIHYNKAHINLAESPFELEQHKERSFQIKGKQPYLAVCYDLFGIKNWENKKSYDFIIGVIHGFDNINSGDSNYARKGLAGASKKWKVHSYASAVFCDNRNLTNWPSGVQWIYKDKSVKDMDYDDIRINNELEKAFTNDIATIYLRYYKE
jgi:hypothetical protein